MHIKLSAPYILEKGLGAIQNIDGHRYNVVIYSAVTETIPEPETAVFSQNRGEPKPQYVWS